MQEIFKDIQGFEAFYQISNLGNVKSFRRNKSKILKLYMSNHGYFVVGLRKDNKVNTRSVHRLIAMHFIPKIEGKEIINHINGIKTDNRIDNLEWCTIAENNSHAFAIGLLENNQGEQSHLSKLTKKEVLAIRQINFDLITQNRVCKIYGVLKQAIHYIRIRRSWYHI